MVPSVGGTAGPSISVSVASASTMLDSASRCACMVRVRGRVARNQTYRLLCRRTASSMTDPALLVRVFVSVLGSSAPQAAAVRLLSVGRWLHDAAVLGHTVRSAACEW